MNAILEYTDERQERVNEWASGVLHPALTRYALLEETRVSIPVVVPRATKVVPTEVLVQDAVERYIFIVGEAPRAVVLHPLRLLSLSRYNEERYLVAGHHVALRTRSGLDVDQVYGAPAPVETAPMERVGA